MLDKSISPRVNWPSFLWARLNLSSKIDSVSVKQLDLKLVKPVRL